jgi:hypothetical protein
VVALIITGVFVVLVLAGSYWLSNVFLRKIGIKTLGEQPSRNRRLFLLSMSAGLVIAAFEAWAFSTNHAAVGVAVLIAFFVPPEFVLIPLRIRRSRRAAKLSRARRTSSDPASIWLAGAPRLHRRVSGRLTLRLPLRPTTERLKPAAAPTEPERQGVLPVVLTSSRHSR